MEFLSRTPSELMPQESSHSLPFPPTFQLEHLLKVAGSVTKDADGVWAEIWEQFKPHMAGDGQVSPGLSGGFTPACGWPEFLEKLWLLKHYLDYVQRICRKEQ